MPRIKKVLNLGTSDVVLGDGELTMEVKATEFVNRDGESYLHVTYKDDRLEDILL